MMNILKICFLLTVLFSIKIKAQISTSLLRSKEIISFMADIIHNEEQVYGKCSKQDTGWTITSDVDKNVASFILGKELYDSHNENLNAGLEELISFLIKKNDACYEYSIQQDKKKWHFVLYNCN